MTRLYLRIYLIVVASLALFALLVALGWSLFDRQDDRPYGRALLAQVVAELVPEDAGAEATHQVLQRWHRRLGASLALFDDAGRLIAHAGWTEGAPVVADFIAEGERFRSQRELMWLPLPDGRSIGARADDDNHSVFRSGPVRGLAAILGFLTLIGVAVALAAWWPARQMTRRLEGLQHTVDAFGAGDLQARAFVRGRDEIAKLARHFNRSADRISALLRSQRSLLANASHELRSPLARIRLAVELHGRQGLDAAERARIQQELQRNVAELDALVEEVLTASRLEAADATAARWETVDLTGLAAEECARLEIDPDLATLQMAGDARLLRRMVRNLLENACRHGGRRDDIEVRLSLSEGPDAMQAHLGRTDGRKDDPDASPARQPRNDRDSDEHDCAKLIVIAVCDRGPGVPADERERIFEPFYRAHGASERSGGVGLGLSLVRQIAQHHGGRARCVAREGGGSCFEVRLPLRRI